MIGDLGIWRFREGALARPSLLLARLSITKSPDHQITKLRIYGLMFTLW